MFLYTVLLESFYCVVWNLLATLHISLQSTEMTAEEYWILVYITRIIQLGEDVTLSSLICHTY